MMAKQRKSFGSARGLVGLNGLGIRDESEKVEKVDWFQLANLQGQN